MAYWRASSLAALGRTEEAQAESDRAGAYPYTFDMGVFLSSLRSSEDRARLTRMLALLGVEVGS